MKHSPPDRNLALELVRVTEAAAMAGGRWVGRGDKNGADGAAVDAMRAMISTVTMNGVVVIGEGEKDDAPMLFNGEQVGDGTGPEFDVAVDPIDGTTLTAKGMGNALSVIAVAPARLDVRPRPPSSTWRSWRPGRTPPTSSTSGSRSPRTSAGSRRPSGVARRRHRRHPRPAAARATRRGGPRDRRADHVHHRRRRRRRHHGRPRGHRGRPAASASAARRRASSRPARSRRSAA